jgi:hypothetical protein
LLIFYYVYEYIGMHITANEIKFSNSYFLFICSSLLSINNKNYWKMIIMEDKFNISRINLKTNPGVINIVNNKSLTYALLA